VIEFERFYDEIKVICDELNVIQLAYFGSVNTPQFKPESDIDFLVQFDKTHELDLFTRYFLLKEYLEKLFHRPVDLVFDKHFKNPFFRKTVEQGRRTIYEARNKKTAV